MALWGKVDNSASMPKFLTAAQKLKTVFVSIEEARLKTNKDKGINCAGWWFVNEYSDADGKPRYKSECLVAIPVPNATSGDAADDATVSDAETTITIATHPASVTAASGGATFSVTASVTSGTLTYKWQKKATATNARWTDIVGATSASLALTGLTAANNKEEYRVVLASTSGAVKRVSNAAVLTV